MRLYLLIFLAVLVSCSDFERLNPLDPKADNYVGGSDGSSNGSGGSSSSGSQGTGLCAGFTDGTIMEHYGKLKLQFCDERDGTRYVYVTIGGIGGKIWMAENLNYNAPDSECYDNQDANCEVYGRLYYQETAKTACPTGWHLPTKDEWNTLMTTVGQDMAGVILKAKTDLWQHGDNGTDVHGFAALPGGIGFNGTSYNYIGREGYWWTATNTWYTVMQAAYNMNEQNTGTSSYLRSVRCVRN